MSALPKAVQKQVAEANRIAAEIKQGGSPPEGSTPPAPEGSTPPAGTNPPTAATPPAPASGAPSSEPPAPHVTPQGENPPEEAWEKRYRVLQGKYNSEVPRLSQQVKELMATVRDQQSQLTANQGMLASLAQRGASAPAAPTGGAPAPSGTKLVKDEEIKAFGADLIDLIRRVAREEFGPQIEQLRPVAQRVEQVAQTVTGFAQKAALTDQQRVLALLAEQVPNFEQLNEDENFIEWLKQTDPYSGKTRHDMLLQAYERNDGPRVVAFFKGFQNEHAAVTPPAQSAPSPAPAAPAAPPAGTPNPLEKFVAPGTAKSGAAGAPNEAQKRIFTAAEIQEFEQRRRRYVTAGKKVPEELVQLEREIVAAGREGRVRS